MLPARNASTNEPAKRCIFCKAYATQLPQYRIARQDALFRLLISSLKLIKRCLEAFSDSAICNCGKMADLLEAAVYWAH